MTVTIDPLALVSQARQLPFCGVDTFQYKHAGGTASDQCCKMEGPGLQDQKCRVPPVYIKLHSTLADIVRQTLAHGLHYYALLYPDTLLYSGWECAIL